MHDASVYVNSGLDGILESSPREMHAFGDSAYPLRNYLMKPFRDNGRLTRKQEVFNMKLSRARTVIERAFGRLKGKFRVLKHLDMSRQDLILKFAMSACFLHNFILANEGLEQDEDCELERRPHNREGDDSGQEKRNQIMNKIC